jgi:alginate O-acetyltransferase complex protein AlgI
MVFTSPTFLFVFLPLVLAAFWIAPARLRTALLVAASWLFYAWGEKKIVVLLALSTLFNWALGLVLDRAQAPPSRRLLLTAGVIVNIGALVYFKYTNLLIASLNALLGDVGLPAVVVAPVHLPIGISFVTFEAVSYVVDVYRRDTPAARSPVHVAFYLSFFPHLIAGPILRFADIAAPLVRPVVTLSDFDRGVSRFIQGLGKKMLIANPMGFVVDQVFALPTAELGASAAWMGIVCYALQIYFDFSGYSDMAIGLGHMLGFTLPENFNLPYTATSVRDFWRRWHMSLSSWFRDYLFRPLGGSRYGQAKTARNLLLVFLLCGFWHGASWRFVIWGAYHGAFLSLERTRFGELIRRAPAAVGRGYTFLVVLVGWVFFRADSAWYALRYLQAMIGVEGQIPTMARRYLTPEAVVVMIVGVLLALRPFRARWLPAAAARPSPLARVPVMAFEMAVFALSLLYVAAGTYNPFIYFRF